MIVDVAIIGGGLSGLAAAVQLAREGAKVALFEQKGVMGGRCYSYTDPVSGDTIDNGQHVLIGAYTSTRRYLDLIGSSRYLEQNRLTALPFHHPSKGFSRFDLTPLLPAFNVPKGLLTSPLLKLSDRLRMVGLASDFVRWGPAMENKLRGRTIEQWLTGHGQSETARNNFWYPLALSVMNEIPTKASAFLFAAALKTAFFDSTGDARIFIPSVGQTELYVTPALQFLDDHAAMVFPNTEIVGINGTHDAADGVVARNGDIIRAGHVISAVPHYAFAKLLLPADAQTESFCHAGKLTSSPIVSVHLWFEKPFLEYAMLGILGCATQWLFNRSMILANASPSKGYCSATISAAYDLVDLSKEDLVAKIVDDIHSIYPMEKTGELLHSVVIKEKRATFSPTNEMELLRPSVNASIHHFHLAGDWTDTGLPPTIEGAVRSGFNAAAVCSLKC